MFGDRAIGAVVRPGRTVRNGYANMDRWATHAKLDTSNGNEMFDGKITIRMAT